MARISKEERLRQEGMAQAYRIAQTRRRIARSVTITVMKRERPKKLEKQRNKKRA